MKNRIIIFGGLGFLGLKLSNKLCQLGFDTIVVDMSHYRLDLNKKVKHIQIDVTKNSIEEFLEIKKHDIFINLASRQYHNKIPYFRRQEWFDQLNFHFTKKTIQLAIDKEISGYIFFSTDMIYGMPQSDQTNEKQFPKPIGEYGKSKLKAENELLKLSKDKIPLTIFRPRLINGPGRLGIFKKLFNLIYNSKIVPIIGNGENCYQMVSVEDCISAVTSCIEKKVPNEIFNLASQKKIKVKNLLNNLIGSANSHSKILPLNAMLIKKILNISDFIGLDIMYKEQYKIADKDIFLDISKANTLLDWYPKYDDQAMINQAYNFWLENFIDK
tara:strand:+ start:944 stop:1927 length:984 start_codon:yes stop_codon:yes gene_type:complete